MSQGTRLVLAALIVLFSVSVGHTIPKLINYQGILEDAGGNPVTTATNVDFAIWAFPIGGVVPLWSETQSVTPDASGRFHVLLGAVTPIPDSAFDLISSPYLGMTIWRRNSARCSVSAVTIDRSRRLTRLGSPCPRFRSCTRPTRNCVARSVSCRNWWKC